MLHHNQEQLDSIRREKKEAYEQEKARELADKKAALFAQCENFHNFLTTLRDKFYDIYGKDYVEHIEKAQKLLTDISDLATDPELVIYLERQTLAACSPLLSALLERYSDGYESMLKIVKQLVTKFANFRRTLSESEALNDSDLPLPHDAQDEIFSWLSIKEATAASTVSKHFHALAKRAVRKKNDASSYEDFLERFKALPKLLRYAILDERYPLQFAEDIQVALSLPEAQRVAHLRLIDTDGLLSDAHINCLISDNGIIAVYEELITIEDAATIHPKTLHLFLTDNAIIALRLQLIALQLVHTKPDLFKWAGGYDYDYSPWILSKNALLALQEEYFTIEDASNLPWVGKLEDEVLIALREQLITFALLVTFTSKYGCLNLTKCLSYLVADEIIISHREKLFTLEQVFNILAANHWEFNPSFNPYKFGFVDAKWPALQRFFNDLSKKIRILVEQSRGILPESPEAFAFIRQQLAIYSKADRGKALSAALARFFTLPWHAHHGAAVAQLLFKEEYATFDKKTFENFIAELNNSVDLETLNKQGDLFAILAVSRKLTGVNFHDVVAKDEELDESITNDNQSSPMSKSQTF